MEIQSAVAAQLPDERPPPMGFIVSVSQGGRMRRLHFAGGCSRVPGQHYKVWEDHGQKTPESHSFTARCWWCVPAEQPPPLPEAEPESSGEESSSSSSSSGVMADESAEHADAS